MPAPILQQSSNRTVSAAEKVALSMMTSQGMPRALAAGHGKADGVSGGYAHTVVVQACTHGCMLQAWLHAV